MQINAVIKRNKIIYFYLPPLITYKFVKLGCKSYRYRFSTEKKTVNTQLKLRKIYETFLCRSYYLFAENCCRTLKWMSFCDNAFHLL